jgi:hypothetical protein
MGMIMKEKSSPPTPEQIAELNADIGTQLLADIVKLINACETDKPPVVAHALCHALVQFIMATEATDEEMPTFSEAGKTAIAILRHMIKYTKYGVGLNDEVIDLRTNQEISPGGFRQ